MSQEIELSIMTDSAATLGPLLEQFTAETRIAVRLRLLSWDNAWSELGKMARQGHGADVSELGSTWVGDLAGQGVLRPFAEDEIAALGTAAAYLPAAWRGGRLAGDGPVWAIPWLVGARLLFYRRAVLERAGVDPETAFRTAAALDETLNRLRDAGVEVPWIVPTGQTHTTLLNVASWVWGAGGDFITPDGRQTLFAQPAARTGLRAYFGLGRYLPPAVRHLRGVQPDAQFLSHPDTALTISGSWLFDMARAASLIAELGVALPPGPSFVGGSYLVIWKHTHEPEAAGALVRFLNQPAAQAAYARDTGLLPARREALAEPPFADDPLWQQVITGVKSGRGFPVTRSWGLVEYRLVAAFSALWAETLAHPERDLDATLANHLTPLAQRLDALLSQA